MDSSLPKKARRERIIDKNLLIAAKHRQGLIKSNSRVILTKQGEKYVKIFGNDKPFSKR
jgi:hypothetical protein